MRRILVIALVAFAAFGSSVATAAWSPTASGSGTAGGLTLGAPTSVAASTLSSSSIRITWSAPTGGSVSPSQYRVNRTSPTTATVCTVTSTTTQCDDTSLSSSTTYTYTVTSLLGTNWTSGASSSASATTSGTPTLNPTIVAGNKTAGTAFAVTITATTNGTTTDTTYSGVKTITFSGPANSPGGNAPTYPATVTFTNGVGTANITLYNAATATLGATDGTRWGTVSITVVAATASQLKYTSSSASCSSGSVVVGNGGTFTSKVTAYDAYLNPVTGALTVALSRSPVQGTLSPTSLSITAGNSETTSSFSYTIPNGNPSDTTVTGASAGLTNATCIVKKN